MQNSGMKEKTSASRGREECALKLCGIEKVYGEGEFAVKALKGVNVAFRKNEFVSILGPSGCGKTTLLNVIGGLDRYSAGDLIIDGRSTKDYKDKDWDAYRNNCIGFVFQSYNLIPHQTVLANVELALELSGIAKKERKAKALSMLDRVGLKGQEHKKPNQLSGGQMQRVAIARALVNDPEIILADEPTGALDTETSVQVMDLLKEVAKDRLVIMVTHNPDLAERYSTRIIRLLDGEVEGDSDAFIPAEEEKPRKTLRKPKMGFKTAFALSLKNLFSKKARTILTSVAGSIGIIGVALVLALSNGFSAYMARMQTDTLASYPLTISESSVDLSTFSKLEKNEFGEKFPEFNNVLVEKAFDKLTGMLLNNKLDDTSENGFPAYLNKLDKNLYYDIAYSYGFDMNDYFYTDIKVGGEGVEPQFMSVDTLVNIIEKQYKEKLLSAMGLNTSFVRQYIPTITRMPDSRELIENQYDLLYGEFPSFDEDGYNQIALVVDEYNGISDITLALLGYLRIELPEEVTKTDDVKFEDRKDFTIEEIVGKEVYLASNSVMYKKYGDNFYFNAPQKSDCEKLKIVGVIRQKENVNGVLSTGFAYTSALTRKVLNDNVDSEIAAAARENGTVTVKSPIGNVEPETFTARTLAGVSTPSKISVYAKSFEAKEDIKKYIDEWNVICEKRLAAGEITETECNKIKITYSDMMSMMFGMLNTMVSAVTYVLVAFTSISLIVSSVMIGIITYISVVERTKEIGVLRALGAAKREVGNVFNAETFLIGLFAGLIGIGVTYLLSIPINLILAALVPTAGSLAVLNPFAAVVMVAISVCLTLISGIIPSRAAAKKDPVVALRSE